MALEREESIAEFLSMQTQAVVGTPSTVDTIIKDQWYYNKSSASLYSLLIYGIVVL